MISRRSFLLGTAAVAVSASPLARTLTPSSGVLPFYYVDGHEFYVMVASPRLDWSDAGDFTSWTPAAVAIQGGYVGQYAGVAFRDEN